MAWPWPCEWVPPKIDSAGQVHGASDRIAAQPVRDPVSPGDLLATVYWLLGVDHRLHLTDLHDRPLALVEGTPVKGLV